MRLDTNIRTFILLAWPFPDTRKAVIDVLIRAKEPKNGFVCTMEIIHGTIDDNVLVLTPKLIGYGWPMKGENILWMEL